MSGSADRETLDGLYDMPVAPQLSDLLRIFERNLKLRLRTSAPAKVITYDAAIQKANLELQFLPVIKQAAVPGGEVPAPPIVITNVPVAWPRAMAGTAYLTLPLQTGDTGQIISCDRSIEAWLTMGVATDPFAFHTHNFADGVFYPGFHPDTTPITPAPPADSMLLEAPVIRLGSLAEDFVIKGTAVANTITPLLATLNAVPAAADPATTQALANANKAAMVGLMTALQANLSIKTKVI